MKAWNVPAYKNIDSLLCFHVNNTKERIRGILQIANKNFYGICNDACKFSQMILNPRLQIMCQHVLISPTISDLFEERIRPEGRADDFWLI